jgi:hypothetical protein
MKFCECAPRTSATEEADAWHNLGQELKPLDKLFGDRQEFQLYQDFITGNLKDAKTLNKLTFSLTTLSIQEPNLN